MSDKAVAAHQTRLRRCGLCADMIGPVVTGQPVRSTVIQVGQAPGIHEGRVGKPFGWTAGKTLFKWYAGIGIAEEEFRKRVYMAAVCRCFPGKNPKGGDRVPRLDEIEQCRPWLEAELKLLRPRLIIPVGKLAIQQFVAFDRLTEVVGRQLTISTVIGAVDCIALPHPSGLSTWHRVQPGKTLLRDALQLIATHAAIAKLFR